VRRVPRPLAVLTRLAWPSAIVLGLTLLPSAFAQQPPTPPAPGAPPIRGDQAFPAQQRPPADPAVIEHGKTLYGIHCRLCHGPDLRGGDMGGVNLLRSALVLKDQDGELILPVVTQGRMPQGSPPMPPLALSPDEVKAVAAYIHSVAAKGARQGGPPPGPPVELNIVVGDATRGQKYFAANCASCHSVTGDLQGLATRYPQPMQLQNAWVAGRAGLGFFGPAPASAPAASAAPPRKAPKPVTVAVTTRDGQRVEGRLDRIDDFGVALIQADGTRRSFRREGDVPKIEISDPLEGHKKLLVKYTDADIHDLTAYLVTLK
jgi:cytochrome c oxidase cbb3-type subunit 3